VLRGYTCDGEPLVVCVEAKAGEPLGATIAEQAQAASKAKQPNPRSNAARRLDELVTRFCRYPIQDARVATLRYQLLTAWAGTITDAVDMAHAVLVLHEFRTDQRPDDMTTHNGAELTRFADAVLGADLPVASTLPWCLRVPDVANVEAAMYVAHVVTDLRTAALTAAQR
jgi:hypothetical protein